MQQFTKYKTWKANRFITDREAGILWKESAYHPRLHCLVGLCLFRGLRISEARALNIRDFCDQRFDRVKIALSKSHIVEEFHIFGEFAKYLESYYNENRHTMVGGYFFPHYKRHTTPYLDKGSANDMFWKFREKLAIKYPEFRDKTLYLNDDGNKYYGHRIGWHSCRRWFITTLAGSGVGRKTIADLLRYTGHNATAQVDTYINCYETWQREGQIIDGVFSDVYKEFQNAKDGQLSLSDFGT